MSDEINPTSASVQDSAEAKQETPATTPAEPVLEPESVPEQETAPEDQTAHPGLDEPLTQESESETESKPEIQEIEPQSQDSHNSIQELKTKAELAVQDRKRKKLDRIMTLLNQKSSITNDDVEKLLHVSDATATRYLSILKKEGRIQQSGRTGKGVYYSKV